MGFSWCQKSLMHLNSPITKLLRLLLSANGALLVAKIMIITIKEVGPLKGYKDTVRNRKGPSPLGFSKTEQLFSAATFPQTEVDRKTVGWNFNKLKTPSAGLKILSGCKLV
jgi:hypothetical protein